jgi:hypothetical protein
VVAALTGTGVEFDEQAAAVVALLALVAGQDVEPAEVSDGRDGRWRIAWKVAPDRVISTVDPQARHTRKSPSSRRDGYRAHVVAEPGTGLITDEQVTMAAGTDNSDPAVAASFLANTVGAQTEPEHTTVAEDTTVGAATDPVADTAAEDDMTPVVAYTAEVSQVGGGAAEQVGGVTWCGDCA